MAQTTRISLFLGVCCAVAAYGIAIVRQNHRRRREAPHVWSWLPLIGSAVSFGRDPLAFLQEQRATHGDVFTAVVAGHRMMFVCDHNLWSSIFRMRRPLQFAPVSHKVLASAFRVKLPVVEALFASADGHLLHNQLTTLLSGDDLEVLTASAAHALKGALHRMHSNGRLCADGFRHVSMYSSVARAVFDTTLDTFFGEGMANDDVYRHFTAFDSQFAFLASGAPSVLFPGATSGLQGQCDALDAAVCYATAHGAQSRLIRARREVFQRLERSKMLSHHEHLRLQATIIWAMTANTLPAAFWTLFYILSDPSAQAAVRAEMESAGGCCSTRLSGGGGASVTQKTSLNEDTKGDRWSVGDHPVLHSCILEALRLATGSMTVRQVVMPCTVPTADGSSAELAMRVGDRVTIFPPLMHYDPTLFGPDPAKFNWRRFITDGALNDAARLVMPFGGGESLCPGRHVAKNEIAQFIRQILLEYDVELLPEDASSPPAFDAARVGLGIYPPATDHVGLLMRPRPSQRPFRPLT